MICGRPTYGSKKILYIFSRFIIRIFAKIFLGFEVRGRELIPKNSGVVVASNHISFLDPMVMGAAFPYNLNFMARSSLFRSFLFGRLIKAVNAFPVERDNPGPDTIRYAIKLLKRNESLLMFPEGTRGNGLELLPGRPGVGLVALKAKAVIVPVFIDGAEKVLPKGSKFIKFKKIKVIFGEPIDTKKYNGKGDRDLYQKISNQIMDSIAKLKASVRE
jgi:1-acyl-sn-glycerol-3-phosphate acyltransferase